MAGDSEQRLEEQGQPSGGEPFLIGVSGGTASGKVRGSAGELRGAAPQAGPAATWQRRRRLRAAAPPRALLRGPAAGSGLMEEPGPRLRVEPAARRRSAAAEASARPADGAPGTRGGGAGWVRDLLAPSSRSGPCVPLWQRAELGAAVRRKGSPSSAGAAAASPSPPESFLWSCSQRFPRSPSPAPTPGAARPAGHLGGDAVL